MRRLALEIGPMRILKVAGKSQIEFFSAWGANYGTAGNMRQSQASARLGRKVHQHGVVAGELGMHLAPARPVWDDVEMAAHVETPWRKNCHAAHDHRNAEPKRGQHLHHASGTGPAWRRHSRRQRRIHYDAPWRQ